MDETEKSNYIGHHHWSLPIQYPENLGNCLENPKIARKYRIAWIFWISCMDILDSDNPENPKNSGIPGIFWIFWYFLNFMDCTDLLDFSFLDFSFLDIFWNPGGVMAKDLLFFFSLTLQ